MFGEQSRTRRWSGAYSSGSAALPGLDGHALRAKLGGSFRRDPGESGDPQSARLRASPPASFLLEDRHGGSPKGGGSLEVTGGSVMVSGLSMESSCQFTARSSSSYSRAIRMPDLESSRASKIGAARLQLVARTFDAAVADVASRMQAERECSAEAEVERLRDELAQLQGLQQREVDLREVAEQSVAKVRDDLWDKICAAQRAQREVESELAREKRQRKEVEGALREEREKLNSAMKLLREQQQQARAMEQKAAQEEQAAKDLERKLREKEGMLRAQEDLTREAELQVHEHKRRRIELLQKLEEEDEQRQDALKQVEERFAEELRKEREKRHEVEDAYRQDVLQLQSARQQLTALRKQSQEALAEQDRLHALLAKQAQAFEAKLRQQLEAQREALLANFEGLRSKLTSNRDAAAEDEVARVRQEKDECQARAEEEIRGVRAELAEKVEELTAKNAILEGKSSNEQMDLVSITSWLDEEIMRLKDCLASKNVDVAGDVVANFEEVMKRTMSAKEHAEELIHAAEAPASDHPSRWCITVAQLRQFADSIREDMEKYCAQHLLHGTAGHDLHICKLEPCPFDHKGMDFLSCAQAGQDMKKLRTVPADMHLVERRYIRPELVGNVGYALLENPGGREVEAFVTHSWNGAFQELVEGVEMALGPTASVWLSSFALPRGRESDDDLTSEAFARALGKARQHVALWDSKADLLDRAWCFFELALSVHRKSPPIFPWLCKPKSYTAVLDKIKRIAPRSLQATQAEDVTRIRRYMTESFGSLSTVASKLRSALTARCETYGSMVEHHSAGLAKLEGRLKTVRQRNNTEMAERLEEEFADLVRAIGNIAWQQLEADDKERAEEVAPYSRQVSGEGLAEGGQIDSANVDHENVVEMVAKVSPDLATVVSDVLRVKGESVQSADWAMKQMQAQLEEAQRQKQQSYEHMQSELEALRVTYRVAVERSAALENELRLRDMALEKLASKTGS